MNLKNDEARCLVRSGLQNTYFNNHSNFTQKLVSAPAPDFVDQLMAGWGTK